MQENTRISRLRRAELGAVFRVEIVAGDWQCSVKSGRSHAVIAKGLKTQSEGRRRAQAHAATVLEVREAAENDAADAEPGGKQTAARRGTRKTHAESRETASAAPEPAPAPPAAPSPLITASGITFRETEDGCLCGKTQGVCWVANAEEVALARPLPEAVKEQIAAAVAQHYAAKKAASNTAAATTPATTARPAKKAARKAAKKEPAPTAARPARAGKREPQTAAPSGPITWSQVEGKPRGAAAHGTFLIEPEGQAFGLYFADGSGQSRHLRSGSMPDLRRAAEEFAARGEPAPLRDTPSREQDEALMRMFASGALEGG